MYPAAAVLSAAAAVFSAAVFLLLQLLLPRLLCLIYLETCTDSIDALSKAVTVNEMFYKGQKCQYCAAVAILRGCSDEIL